MELFKNLIQLVNTATVEFDNIWPNTNYELERYENRPYDHITFNDYYSPNNYSLKLNSEYEIQKNELQNYVLKTNYLNDQLNKIHEAIVSFQSISQKFYFVRIGSNPDYEEYTFRDDIQFNFNDEDNFEPAYKLRKWLAHFLNIQREIISRSLSNLGQQRERILNDLSNKSISRHQIIDTPEYFKIKGKSKEEIVKRLDIRQTSLLFYYLRKHEAIRYLSDTFLSELLHYLTGYSAQNLRGRTGFQHIWDINDDTVVHKDHKEEPFYNLNSVKSLLNEIITEIDDYIKKTAS